jgi:hypothetical protein
MSEITVREIIKAYLVQHGYDGCSMWTANVGANWTPCFRAAR